MSVILGYALNMMALELYNYTGNGNEVLHKGNISMTVASIFMIAITVSEIHLRSWSIIIIICIYYILYIYI